MHTLVITRPNHFSSSNCQQENKDVMKTLLYIVAVLLALTTCASTAVTQQVHDSLLVSTDWLAKHLNDESLVLLQVGEKQEYTEAHIPRAQFVQLADISTPRGQGLALELPSNDQLKATFEALGVSDKSRIVIYFSKDWLTPTARVFMTLDYLGLGSQTAILDGGLPAWKASGGKVTSELATPVKGSFSPHPNKNLIVDWSWINAHLNDAKVRILDARAPQFYSGTETGRMPRGGHIPGAKNIPFSSLVDESSNKFKNAASLRELFAKAQVEPNTSVATYCHIGQQASLLYFVARYLGYEAHLYDGSFEDWSNRKDLPVDKSSDIESKP